MTTPSGLLTFCLLALAQPPVPPSPAAPVPKSPAELIADTRDSIKQGEQTVLKLQAQLDSRVGEYKAAESDFEELNQKLKDAKTKAMKLAAEGKPAEAKAVEAQVAVIEKDWKLARERFDIAIQKRQTRREALENLKERIAADQKRLAELEGKTTVVEPPKPTPTPDPKTAVAPSPRPVTPPARPEAVTPTAPAAPPATEAPKPATDTPKPVIPTLPGLPPAIGAAPATAPPFADKTPPADTPAAQEIRDRLAKLRAAQATAEARLKVAQERMAMQGRFQQMAEKSRKLDREALEQAKKAIARADEILAAQPPPTAEEWQRAEKSRNDATERAVEIKGRLDRVADRIAKLRETTDDFRAEEVAAAAAADKAKAAADAADAELTAELNPTSVRNVTKWILDRGPHMLMIVAVTLLIHLFVRQFSRQFVRLAARNNRRGSVTDRENRLNTLIGVFRYVAGLVIIGGGIVSLLDVMNVPVGTIIGGAAVIGLAVAFGAQNLIRDYFTGFIMLLEDQYSVNDVVRIGSLSGLVEHISLRMTVLRDLEGVRHFIPHGGITGVSNLTHTWSRALFDVAVAYKENVDIVMRELLQLGRDMRADPTYGRDILEDPEMLGVDSLADSGVIIKFLMKTRPLQQWPIKREMLRRIKNRFDELGIEIPFPHRTVYHRVEEGDVGAKLLHGLAAHRAA